MIRSGWGRPNPTLRQLFASLFRPGVMDEQVHTFNELSRTSTTPDVLPESERARATFADEEPADWARVRRRSGTT